MNHIGVALSGSGTLYPLFAGSLEALEEERHVAALSGCSGGAIIAALRASGFTPFQIRILLLENPPSKLIDFNWSFRARGALKGDKLFKLFKKYLPERIGDTEMPLSIVTTNLTQSRVNVWSTTTTPEAHLPTIVRASMSIPFVFTPVLIDGDLHVDGGLVANFPVDLIQGLPVIGISTRGNLMSTDRKGLRTRTPGLIEYFSSLVDTAILSNMRESANDTRGLTILGLNQPGSGLKFFNNRSDVDKLYRAGYMQTRAFGGMALALMDKVHSG